MATHHTSDELRSSKAPAFCRCYQLAMLPLSLMHLAVLLSVALLIPTTVLAHEYKVTAEGMSEEFAIGEAMRQIPKGSSVTDTSCRTQDVGMSTRYWRTLNYTEPH